MTAKKSKKVILIFGEARSIKEWAKHTGLSRRVLAYRIANGWGLERAVSQSATVGNNQFMIY